MDTYTLIALAFAMLYCLGLVISKWSITKGWFQTVLRGKWVNRLYWVIELLVLSLFWVDDSGFNIVAGAILLCCLPAILRWTTAPYEPPAPPVAPQQL